MTERAIADRDIADALCEQVRSAYDARTPLRIVGGDTRAFYGRPVEGQALPASLAHAVPGQAQSVTLCWARE